MARIDLFRMERMQAQYWHQVEYDLSESGVTPLSIEELLGEGEDTGELLRTRLGYPLSEGSESSRELIAQWYPGRGSRERHDDERGVGGEPHQPVDAARTG
jgi:hypothetical protein